MTMRVLAKMVATVRGRGMMYKVMVKLVILYGSESWVVTGAMLKFLGGLHHREARCITGMTATHGAREEWGYPPVVPALESSGLHLIMDYIRR